MGWKIRFDPEKRVYIAELCTEGGVIASFGFPEEMIEDLSNAEGRTMYLDALMRVIDSVRETNVRRSILTQGVQGVIERRNLPLGRNGGA